MTPQGPASGAAPLEPDALLAPVRDAVAAELAAQRGRSEAELAREIAANDRLDAAPVRMDSLERLAAAQRVNELFRLHTLGTEDYLLRHDRLAEWGEVIRATIARGTDGLAFRSGGTTGAPRTLIQSWEHLDAELEVLAELVVGTRRIVLLVPSHHIYGCLWGPLLATRLEVPLVPRHAADDCLHGGLRAGDLVVGFPERWRYFAGTLGALAPGVTGVTSTAPCPPAVWPALRACGLERLLEIFGSSETGGIGWRDDPASGFELFSHWRMEDARTLARADGTTVALPDRVHRDAAGGLWPQGRRDEAVQIGGVNVSPAAVVARMRACPDVADCAVRPFDTGAGLRLKAFIVPADGSGEAVRERVASWLHDHLPAPERPSALTFGDALPRSDLGKLRDW